MIRGVLLGFLEAAVASLQTQGLLPSSGLPEIEISDPKDPSHGDFACNFALAAAKAAGKPPREVAEMLVAELLTGNVARGTGDGGTGNGEPGVGNRDSSIRTNPNQPEPTRTNPNSPFQAIEIAGPGFINLRLDPAWTAAFVGDVLSKGKALAQTSTDRPLKINVEFVSVNPNGPITIGSGRGAAYGSTLCNVLAAAGHTVHREYYINDGVNSEQMREFARAVRYFAREIAGVLGDNDSLAGSLNECLGFWNHFIGSELTRLGINAVSGERALLAEEPMATIRTQFSAYLDTIEDTRVLSCAFPLDHASERLASPELALQKLFGLLPAMRDYYSGLTTGAGPDFRSMPALPYRGEYVEAVADALVEIYGDCSGRSLDWFQQESQAHMLLAQRSDLDTFGTTFDTWFSEQSLHDSGVVAHEIAALAAAGAADERPIRTKLKLARGGAIEEVIVEAQDSETDDLTTDDLTTGGEPSSVVSRQVLSGQTLWLRATKFGDDMDRVLRRKDGRLTYIASDIAYHKDKFNRPANADKLITILGPDHHGYIARLHAVLAALELAGGTPPPSPLPIGDGEGEFTEIEAKLYASPAERDACQTALKTAREKLEVVIYQLVRFMKDGKPAPMRKRDGNIYAIIDLIKEIGQHAKPNAPQEEQMKIGKDVARFFYLMRSHDTTFDFDLDLAEKQSDENPVFYVQYAHARICSVLKKAEEAKISKNEAYEKLTDTREQALIRKICDLPHEVQRAAEDYGVHRLTTYAIELARTYHAFYDACRVVEPSNLELSGARYALCEATKVALQAVFDLLGIEAPEKMERDSVPLTI